MTTPGRFAVYGYFGSLYGFSVALLYLLGYWWYFGIDILEYLSLSDVVRVSLPFVALATLEVAAVAGVVAASEATGDPLSARPLRGKLAYAAIALVCFAVVIVFGLALGVLGFLVVVFIFGAVAGYLSRSPLLIALVPNAPFRGAVLGAIVMSFIAPCFLGHVRARMVDKWGVGWPSSAIFVEYSSSVLVVKGSYYLGMAGDSAFFLSPDKKVVIAKTATVQPMVLSKHNKPPWPMLP